MNILNTDYILDGGTLVIKTDEGDYAIDNRIRSFTKGKLYFGYPQDNDENLISNPGDVIEKLTEAIKESQLEEQHKTKILNLIKKAS